MVERREKRYKVPGKSRYTKIPDTPQPINNFSDISNSYVHEELVRVVHGFRPDFEQAAPAEQSRPLRTMKTKKMKNQKGKRVLKRVHYEATSAVSSHSSLVSEYINDDLDNQLEENSKAQMYEELEEMKQNGNMDVVHEHSQEDSDHEEYRIDVPSDQHLISPLRHKGTPSSDEPADEHFDSEANLEIARNSPRESFKVFNQ